MTNAQVFTFFIIGFTCGFITIDLLSTKPDENPQEIDFSPNPPLETSKVLKNIRILCVLLTSAENSHSKAIHVRQTWGKHCDKLIFASSKTDNNLGAIDVGIVDDHDHLWGKIKQILHYVHENFVNDYDWVFKGDDDTFVWMENMRYMLAAYSPEDPIYFGHKFNTSAHKFGYFSGGSGYAMSRKALKLFAEKVLMTNESVCDASSDTGAEDWNMGLCFDEIGVYPLDARDLMKQKRFLTLSLEHHMYNYLPDWYIERHFYYKPNDDGLNCCSKFLVSAHYADPQTMYTKYFLTSHLRKFGIQNEYPPLPINKNFKDILRNLEQQREQISKRS